MIEKEVMHGYIDFIAYDHHNQHIDIVDFKTDRMHKKEAFIQAYRQQLATYAKAISQLYPDYSITTHIYSFFNNDLYTI